MRARSCKYGKPHPQNPGFCVKFGSRVHGRNSSGSGAAG
jgi:hypothetical protein